LLTVEQLAEVELWQTHYGRRAATFRTDRGRRLIHETVRRIINTLDRRPDRYDLAQSCKARAGLAGRVRAAPPLVAHSEAIAAQAAALKRFLFKKPVPPLSRDAHGQQGAPRGGRFVRCVHEDPRLLPPGYQSTDASQQPRLIAHYIAGMTDRYAVKEYQRLFVIDDN
jgi:dGTP triphosphohydrolase